MESRQFDELLELSSNATSLPELPESAFQLVRELNSDSPNSHSIERFILSDPSLTASVLRASNSALYGLGSNRVTTIRAAITVMGELALRDLAMAMLVQSSFQKISKSAGFDPRKFASHGAFVGFLAKYIHSIALRSGKKSGYSPDELFAIGVLHDLGVGSLAYLAPDLSRELNEEAMAIEALTEDVFFDRFGQPLSRLTTAAGEAWSLPERMMYAVAEYRGSASHATESLAMSSLTYANQVAENAGYGVHAWHVHQAIEPDVQSLVGLGEDDLPDVTDLVSRFADGFVMPRAA